MNAYKLLFSHFCIQARPSHDVDPKSPELCIAEGQVDAIEAVKLSEELI